MDEPIGIGTALGQVIDTLLANLVPLVVLAALLAGVPGFLFEYWRAGGAPAILPAGTAFTIASLLILTALSAMFQVIALRMVIAQLEGRPRRLWADVGAGLVLFVPVTVLMAMVTIAVMLGLIVLIVPGLIFYVMYSVAVPVYVAERPGLLGALSRSQDLTEGVRWRLFAILAIYWGFAVLLSLLSQMAGVSAGDEIGSAALSLALATGVTDTIASAAYATLIAAIYVALRRQQDGPGGQFADVFA